MPDPTSAKPLTIDIDRSGAAAVVHCHGRLIAGVGEHLYAQVKPLLHDYKRVVLDLTDLTHVDSMGLGALVRLYVSSRSAGCELVLMNLGMQVRKALALTNLLSVFAIIGEHGIKMG
jgi:anti-sigma B factor antagonist